MMLGAGVEFTYHTQLIDIIKDGNHAETAVIASKAEYTE